ncbi:patched domain-containing protein 3-like [Hyperolius riggenbachi]|uniref:patched domain-containing protein 3-like n=1 Tax=Hyperolius riggenbachi TaxID=752182 RepID=UPI0035A34FF3
MTRCRTDCIERPLSAAFYKLGMVVGRYPWWFLFIPMFISIGLGSGFYFLPGRQDNDIEAMFTPVGGPAKLEREFVRKHFPTNDSAQFSAQRLYTEGSYVSFIAISECSNVLFNSDTFKELVKLDEMVKNFSIVIMNHHQVEVRTDYQHLCPKTRVDQCSPANPLLSAVHSNASLIEKISISYPLLEDKTFLGSFLGGVELNPDNTVKSAKAIRLIYYLREDNELNKNSHKWIKNFIRSFSRMIETLNLQHVKISYFSSVSRQQEFEASSKSVIPLFSITYFITICFSITSCVRFDCVRNKVWVANFGVLTAGLAILSSFGLLLICGLPFVITVGNAPFLILGVGADDMFIMISSWQQTKVEEKVEKRMAKTYSEAAVSIAITTLTDVVAFYIGILTPFQSVQLFCIYTGVAILFCFLYNITFFGAFLALNGRREESNKHWFNCKKVREQEEDHRSSLYNICCIGGRYNKNTGKEEDHPITNFFHEQYGPFLTNMCTKILVLVLYGGYLGGSIYWCLQVQEGIDLRNLATDRSYVRSYYDNEDLYFSEYGPRVMVVVTNETAYWDSESRDKISRCLKSFGSSSWCLESFESTCYVSNNLSESWLEMYLRVAGAKRLNISDKNHFIEMLSIFNTTDYYQDVEIQEGAIRASRFFIQTMNVASAVDERDMLNQVRHTAKNCEIPVLVFHPAFIYYDQYAVITKNTVQNVGVAVAVMLVISILLIPSLLCSLWVTFTCHASIIVGVTGFMAYWDVNLDSISMINLVICIGFSVDFSAHISYAFVSSKKPKSSERVVDALHSLGYPILQGGVSTILGVVVLSTSDSYIFRTFFKIIFLVIALGMLHGLVFLPVLLTLFGNCGRNRDKVTKVNSSVCDLYVNNLTLPNMVSSAESTNYTMGCKDQHKMDVTATRDQVRSSDQQEKNVNSGREPSPRRWTNNYTTHICINTGFSSDPDCP